MNPHFHLQTALNMMPSFTAQPNFRPIPINSPFLHPYFPMLPEFMASRFQPQALMQTPNNYILSPLNDVKIEFSVKLEGQYGYVPKQTKIEPSDKDLSLNGSDITTPSYIDQLPTQINLKSEIEKMVRFLLSNMGKDNDASIAKTRDYYLHNPCLLEVYDKISMKYYSAKKCKEDLIRYILRKVFRQLRVSIMKKENVSSKKASLLMCKRYFNPGTVLPESEIEDEEKFLESLMPYNKNSKNKTMNISFILEIFSSPNFCKEYQDFLPKLYTILAEDNKKKEAKLVKFILDCVEKKSMEKINTLQRLPWLDVWTEDAKNLAIAIMPNKRLIYNPTKPKN